MDKTNEELIAENEELKKHVAKMEQIMSKLIAMLMRLDGLLLNELHILGTVELPEVVLEAQKLLKKKEQ